MSAASHAEGEDAPTDCNGVPHMYYSAEHGAHCRVMVGKCIVCGQIDWADLAHQAAKIADHARAEERERIASALEAVDPVEWALAGVHAGQDAARIARTALGTEKPNA